MLSVAEPAAPDSEARAELHGVVDNVGADKLYGWAWNLARPGERVAVELRLADRTVLRTVADFARADLPKAGIGDGNHAFEIRLNAEWIERRAELSVVAVAADGTEQQLPIRVRRSPETSAAATQRGVDALVAAQRQLREELRALASRLPPPGEVALGERLAAAQARLEERLEALEVWLARLDAHLAAPPAAPARRGADGWQLLLFAVLALSALAALAAAAVLGGW